MAGAMKKAMKKMIAKKQKAEKKVEEEEDEDESEEESSSGEEEEASSAEESEEEAKQAPSVKQDANKAKREVANKQRFIARLESKNAELAKKIKDNKALINKTEKEMEPIKAVLANKRRILNRQKNDKFQALEEKRKAKESRFRKTNAKRVKAAQKRLEASSQGIRKVKANAEDAKMALKRAQSKVDECMRTCKDLKAKGERVPEDFKDDFSSPHAWKPPGYVAAKALAAAKETLSKTKEVYDKVWGVFEKKDLKRKASQNLLEEVKNKPKSGGKAVREEVEEVATPTRSGAAKKKQKSGR